MSSRLPCAGRPRRRARTPRTSLRVTGALALAAVTALSLQSASATSPGATGSAFVPSAVHASLPVTDGFSITVEGVNRSSLLGPAGPLSGTQGYVCVYASKSTKHAGLVTITSETGCGDVHDYSYDPTDWTASLAGRLPTQLTVLVARPVGRDLFVLSERRSVSTAVVAFAWTGTGEAVIHHTADVYITYLPGADANVWLSKRARSQGSVSFAGLHRRFAGVDLTAGMATGDPDAPY